MFLILDLLLDIFILWVCVTLVLCLLFEGSEAVMVVSTLITIGLVIWMAVRGTRASDKKGKKEKNINH